MGYMYSYPTYNPSYNYHEPPSKPEILKLKPKQGPEISERCDYGLQAGGRRLPGGTLGFYKGSMRVARRVLTMIPYISI